MKWGPEDGGIKPISTQKLPKVDTYDTGFIFNPVFYPIQTLFPGLTEIIQVPGLVKNAIAH